jgi:L-asparaginase
MLEQARVKLPVEVVHLMRKDSLDITDDDRESIVLAVRDHPATRIVITHGTDTMVSTAATLRFITNKTIVLTGALEPARFAQTDAMFNLGLALGAVQSLACGVYLAMNGRVFAEGRVRKNMELNRFEEVEDGTSSST